MKSSVSSQFVKGLSKLLADTYTLYLKTQNFHWHVTGPHFHSLHKMFEEEYIELAAAVDTIAERIRTLGYDAPASFKEFLKLSSIKEESKKPSASGMVKKLLTDHQIIIKHINALLPAVQEAEDEVTVDLLIERLETHEKTSWMLRSSI